jgi:hypothetical protein
VEGLIRVSRVLDEVEWRLKTRQKSLINLDSRGAPLAPLGINLAVRVIDQFGGGIIKSGIPGCIPQSLS